MQPNTTFSKQPRTFWAQIKLISMNLGYAKGELIKTYTAQEIVSCLESLDLSTDHLIDTAGVVTSEGQLLVDYFVYRAKSIKENIEPSLMTRDQAKIEFEKITSEYKHTVSVPYNKQKAEKRHQAYLTGLVNVLTEKTLGSLAFDPDPRQLTVFTKNRKPVHTLARRVDGAYPSIVNPLAIWEIKEYYGTTSFGSRVADGVYISMLDGYELEELRENENIEAKHYLIIDDHFTWWGKGKSYLCRMVDMVNEGFLDEVIVGRQVLTRWPEIVKGWNHDSTTSTVESREHLLQS